MFTISGRSQRLCNGVSRREFLRAGALGIGGLTLADLLRAESQTPRPGRPKSIIYLVLNGGISHIDTWDPKPDAPLEFRGEFSTIPTKHPGVRFCEYFPQQAAVLDRLTLVRGIASVENDHFLSEVYSGLPRTAGARPAFGSIVSKLSPPEQKLPPYVCLNHPETDRFEFQKPHYVGSAHAPFRPFEDALDNLSPVKTLDRLADRKELLAGFDRLQRGLDRRSDLFTGLDQFQAKALEMITSPEVRRAFDLKEEPADTFQKFARGKYTHQTVAHLLYDWDPKPLILARRLVEAGVRVVTLQMGAWDHHSSAEGHIFNSYRHCLPVLDQNIRALVDDLTDRGLINDTLVCVLGEFGRTPKVTYPGPGREHWADAGAAIFAGGGLKMGQVIGETDARAERAKSGRITFQNILATFYHVLGIDPAAKLPDFAGRPQYLLDDPTPIRELVA